MMASKSGSYDAVMPDMKLWSEIIFLQNFTKNTNIKFVVENVKPYYEPLIKPTAVIGRHYFWANFRIPFLKVEKQIGRMNGKGQNVARANNLDKLGFDLSKYEHPDKDKLLRNCVAPEIGLAIFESAMNIYKDNNGNKTKVDEIFDLQFFKETDSVGDLLYWGWYGISSYNGVIDDNNLAKGIRLRKNNIQVGSKHTLLKLHKDKNRGNY